MLCENCNKREGQPSVYILNGVTKVRYLCPECSSQLIKFKMGTELGSGFLYNFGDIFDDFSDIFGDVLGKDSNIPIMSEQVCPRCKTSNESFLNSGFVGCSDCYKFFEPLMDEIIRKCQKDNIHVGKGPNGIAQNYVRLQKMNTELKKAIKDERYEDAAQIKKEMEQLKGASYDKK